MRRFCGHYQALRPGVSERSADIAAGEECDGCCQAAVERDIAAGRRPITLELNTNTVKGPVAPKGR